jgi:glyoxylase-like metal-dependent hydrolase (beta-lactamase superfamily II)
MKITEHIYMVGSGNLGMSQSFDGNTYLLDLGEELVMIDSGVGLESERIVRNIKNDNLDISRLKKILLSHSHVDHAGGAHYFHKNFGCSIYASEEEAYFVEKGTEKDLALDIAKASGLYTPSYQFTNCPVSKKLVHNEIIKAGDYEIKAIITPGHSIGSVCYHISLPEGDALFSADTLFANGLICVLNCDGSSHENYRKYLKRLDEVKIDMLFPGHNHFVLSEGRQSLKIALKRLELLGLPQNLL